MRTISIDDDLYELIASHTKEIGEPASKILRRLLMPSSKSVSSVQEPLPELFKQLLNDHGLKYQTVAYRYLSILSAAYFIKKEEFEKILNVRGRDRNYFGKSAKEISETGRKTHPKEIPGTPYWAMTNSSTKHKAEILHQALVVIGFSEETASAMCTLIQ